MEDEETINILIAQLLSKDDEILRLRNLLDDLQREQQSGNMQILSNIEIQGAARQTRREGGGVPADGLQIQERRRTLHPRQDVGRQPPADAAGGELVVGNHQPERLRIARHCGRGTQPHCRRLGGDAARRGAAPRFRPLSPCSIAVTTVLFLTFTINARLSIITSDS